MLIKIVLHTVMQYRCKIKNKNQNKKIMWR